MRELIRFHYEANISLKDMQKKCNTEKKGLCCIERSKPQDLLNFLCQVMNDGDTGEVVVFEGEVWGACLEGYTAYPVNIINRVSVVCRRDENGLMKLYKKNK